MTKSPTYIHFRVQWQLLGPESPGQRFERQLFQDLLATLNADRRLGGYDDFSYRPDRCELAKVRETETPAGGVVEAFSKVLYENDRLTVVEEWAEMSTEEFARKLADILNAWFKHFPQTLAVIQRCWLRALVSPSHCADSRQFIGDLVLRLGEHLKRTFDQMPHQVGFTVGCQRSWDNQPVFLDTKVYSWRDNRSVWVEVGGMSPLAPPINATAVDRAQMLFAKCKDFLEGEVIKLLHRFDTGSSGGTQDGGNQ